MLVVPIFNVAKYQFKSLRFIAVFASLLAVFSIACGSSQIAEEPSTSVKSAAVTTSFPASTEKREPTRTLKPDATQEAKDVSKPSPTKSPTTNSKPELTPTLTPSKAVEVERTPTPLPQPTPTPLPTKKVFDRSHHVATGADLVKLADPDTKKALLNPAFLDANEAGEQYSDSELVIGLSVNGQHKAYSTSFMSTWIVNDTVGGEPMLVTY